MDVIVTGATIAAVDRETGLHPWSMSLGDGPMAAHWEGDALYVTSAHKVARLHPENGTLVWERIEGGGLSDVSWPRPDWVVLTRSSPDTTVILSADDGRVISSSPGTESEAIE